MDYRETARKVKEASIILGALDEETRNRALAAIADALTAEKEKIFEANRKDLEEGASLPGPILGRLKFDDHKLQDVAAGIRGMISLEDPVGKILFRRELDQDLVLTRVTCPIGVIGVIFESRPDALVQISSLCVKSGNGAILKGGSEARRTNRGHHRGQGRHRRDHQMLRIHRPADPQRIQRLCKIYHGQFGHPGHGTRRGHLPCICG